MTPKLRLIILLLILPLFVSNVYALDNGCMYTDSILPSPSLLLEEEVIMQTKDLSDLLKINIYDQPYSLSASYGDKKQLWENTGGIVGGMLIATGVMMMLPDDVTNWTGNEGNTIFSKWYYNVKKGPVHDKDGFLVNYILHPYSGAVYYMNARSAGYNAWQSLLYVTFVSNVVWEYGLEAFAEPPSLQDLLCTPTIGALMGEGFYLAKRQIVANDYHILGSRAVGKVIVFVIDPVSEVMDAVLKRNKKRSKDYSLHVSYPTFGRKSLFSLRLTF